MSKKKRRRLTQAQKLRILMRNPFGDYDKDGVPNWKDCRPFDKSRHYWYREDPSGGSTSAGEAAMSPSEAAERGYVWKGTGGTYGRAPSSQEYAGIIAEKHLRGHYGESPAVKKQIEAELMYLRKKHGADVTPPWGTPKKWQPYIRGGKFEAPEVRAFHERWQPHIQGEQFIGSEAEYSTYLHEREAALAAQEKAYGTYTLEHKFSTERAKAAYEGALAEQAAREWETGAFSMGKEPVAKEEIRGPITRAAAWWSGVNTKLMESKYVLPLRYEMLKVRHALPAEMKNWPISPEFSFGTVEGVLEKPATAAVTYGAFTAMPWAFGRAGAAIRPVSKAASEVFPKAGPMVAKWVPRALGYGMGAAYGVSVEERVRHAEPGARARELGKIYGTEIVPMFAGWETGRGLLALRKTPTPVAVKSVREVYEYDVATRVKAETIAVPDAPERVGVRVSSRGYPESALSQAEIARWKKLRGELALPVEYKRTMLSARGGVAEETGEGLMLVSRSRAEGLRRAYLQMKWGGEGRLVRDVLEYGTLRGEYKYKYDILAQPEKIMRTGIYPEGTPFGYKPRGYRFARGGVSEEFVSGKVWLEDIGRYPKSGAKFSHTLSKFTGGKPKAMRDVAKRLTALQVGSGIRKGPLGELEAEILAAERAGARQTAEAQATFSRWSRQAAPKITQRQAGGGVTVFDTATSQENLSKLFGEQVQGSRFAPPEHVQRILRRRLVGYEEFYQPAPQEMFKTRGIVFPKVMTSPREATLTAVKFKHDMTTVQREQEKQTARMASALKLSPFVSQQVALKPVVVQVPKVDVRAMQIVEPRTIQAQKQEAVLKTALRIKHITTPIQGSEYILWEEPFFPPRPIPLAWPETKARRKRKAAKKQRPYAWYIFNPVTGAREALGVGW